MPETSCDVSLCTCFWDSRDMAPSNISFMPTAVYHIRVVVWNRLGKAHTRATVVPTRIGNKHLFEVEGGLSCISLDVFLTQSPWLTVKLITLMGV